MRLHSLGLPVRLTGSWSPGGFNRENVRLGMVDWIVGGPNLRRVLSVDSAVTGVAVVHLYGVLLVHIRGIRLSS